MSSMKKNILIFDFDGVIADSFEHNFQTNKSIYKDMTPKRYREWFHGNIYDSINRHSSMDNIESIKEKFWELYIQGLDKIKIFPEIKNMLNILSKSYYMVIVSSTRSEIIENLLQNWGANKYFFKTYGSDYHESKIEKFKHVLRDFKICAERECLFFTDTLGDLREAEKVGIESIAVSWGFHDAETLKRGKFKAIIHKPEEILDEVANHFSGYQQLKI